MTDRSVRLIRPDDWHLHLRDGTALRAVVPATAQVFGRAIVMPNLRPPITTTASARAYRDRILAAIPAGSRFTPLMTLYLTDDTSAAEIAQAKASGFVHAVKYYPAGATTNSQSGVTALARAYPALSAMERHGVVLSVHGEVTDADVDVFDRERVFVERELTAIVRDFPGLRIVLEHITTKEAAAFVTAAPPTVAATITPQHLAYSRNALFAGGLRPHLYCLPVLKREAHRRALVAAATSGNAKFFLGTDSAPHEGREGKRLRLRRLLFRAGGIAALRRDFRERRRARLARRFRGPARIGVLWPACKYRFHDARARNLARARIPAFRG